VINVRSNFGLTGGLAHFTNTGTINLNWAPARMVPWWPTHLQPEGTVHYQIDGPASNQCSQIYAWNGDVDFGGSLAVRLGDGFVPTNGSVFQIAQYRKRTNTFDQATLPALPPGLRWRVDYGDLPSGTNNHRVTLHVERNAMTQLRYLTNGHFQFSFAAEPSSACIIDATEDLGTWTPVFTNAPFTGTLLFDDAQAVNYSNRFYRIRLEP